MSTLTLFTVAVGILLLLNLVLAVMRWIDFYNKIIHKTVPIPFTSNNPQYLDGVTLDQLTRLSTRSDFFEDLVNQFLDEVNGCLERMEIALQSTDIIQIRHNAHVIQAAARNIGATQLSETASKIYHAPNKEIRRNGQFYFDQLAAVIIYTKSALKRYNKTNQTNIEQNNLSS